MSLILSGTDGLSDVDGSAATPAIRGTDANTGIFFPAADTIAFSEGGVESMRVDSSGRLLIGTNSGTRKLTVYENAAQVDISIVSSTTGVAIIQMGDTAADNQGQIIYRNSTDAMEFGVNGAERMRIDSSGNLLVGTTNTSVEVGVGLKFLTGATQPAICTVTDSASGNNYLLYNTNATNNGYRFYVNYNGGVYNYSGNNSNISDERTKTDIQNAGNYLAKICAIPVRTFKYKDQNDDLLTLGVIAQEVESIAPELVNVDGFGETPEDGIPLKAIYQTDLQYALMKCIQEQQALIQSLTARITALETP